MCPHRTCIRSLYIYICQYQYVHTYLYANVFVYTSSDLYVLLPCAQLTHLHTHIPTYRYACAHTNREVVKGPNILLRVEVRFSVLKCVLVCCSALQCVAVCFSVSQCGPNPHPRECGGSQPPHLYAYAHTRLRNTLQHPATHCNTTYSCASLEAVKYPQSLSPSGSSPSASTISISSHPSPSRGPFPPTLFTPF